MDRLLSIMARLRDPASGCPWDLAQSFATIAPYTIEEAYEVAEAIEQKDMPGLKEELGDLLLQVVFHARMAEEAGHFSFDEVAGAIADKMVARHPHVFAEERFANVEEQKRDWESRKAVERASRGAALALDGLARGLPALVRAEKLQQRAARVGFDWPETLPVVAKIGEELAELKAEIESGASAERLHDELGDLLFSVVNLARHLRLDPEAALRHGNAKFERRFRAMESSLHTQGKELRHLSLDELEAAWQRAKAADAAIAPNRPTDEQAEKGSSA